MIKFINKKYLLTLGLGLALLGVFLLFPRFFISAKEERATPYLELDQQIKEKRGEIDELQEKQDIYERNIRLKQQEGRNLVNEVEILDSEIAKNTLEIEKTEKEIETLNLEIESLVLKIREKEGEITKVKSLLSYLLREINRLDQKSTLEITFQNETLSDFFDQMRYLEDIQKKNKELLSEIKSLRQELEERKKDLSNKKTEQENKKAELEQSKEELEGKRVYKENLLVETKLSETKFKTLLDDLKQEAESQTLELASLERKAREKLEKGDLKNTGDLLLGWPVSPDRGISAYFYDPDYPFRYLFEHPAIDIRASQGTPIAAAESGYVAVAKNAGMGYSYIMILHNEEISTVYGHVSQIYVSPDQYVQKGDIIGLSGGKPGTPGAGRLTTGPHLHFEVRLNGIPVNPLDYLP